MCIRDSCNCYAAIAAPTSNFATIASTNALSILRVPGDTATLKLRKLLLLTSFAAVTTAIAYADASVARVALLTVIIDIARTRRHCYAETTETATANEFCCSYYSDRFIACYELLRTRATPVSAQAFAVVIVAKVVAVDADAGVARVALR